MASSKENFDISCESCKKLLTQSTILRHIGKRDDCKAYYGERYTMMKKEQARKRVYKHRESVSMKQKKRSLQKSREIYAKNDEKKDKRKIYYQKKKDLIKVTQFKMSMEMIQSILQLLFA